jgi:hypothetical protein
LGVCARVWWTSTVEHRERTVTTAASNNNANAGTAHRVQVRVVNGSVFCCCCRSVEAIPRVLVVCGLSGSFNDARELLAFVRTSSFNWISSFSRCRADENSAIVWWRSRRFSQHGRFVQFCAIDQVSLEIPIAELTMRRIAAKHSASEFHYGQQIDSTAIKLIQAQTQ